MGKHFLLFSRVGGGDLMEDESREERPLSLVKDVTKAVCGFVQRDECFPPTELPPRGAAFLLVVPGVWREMSVSVMCGNTPGPAA